MSIHTLIRRFALPGAAAVAFALLAACGDRGGPVAVPEPTPPAPRVPALLAALDCTANTRAGTVKCGRGTLPSAARGYIVVGGQHQYVELTSGPATYDAGTQVLSFDVTVGNLIPQPMGTEDGTTADPEGVRVFFYSGPTVTNGAGTASVLNHDAVDVFTSGNQKLFRYAGTLLGGDGILGQNETSSEKTWQISVGPGVVTFTFQLYVVAEVPFPQGYVELTPPADTLVAGGTATLSATVRTAVGVEVPGQTVTWGTSDPAVATVNAAGQVTALAPGSATITATAGTRSGSVPLQVCPSLAVGGVYLAAGGQFCLAGAAGAQSEYTVTPVNLGLSNLAFSLTGAGIVPASGPPTPVRTPGVSALLSAGPAPDEAFHLRTLRAGNDLVSRLRRGAPEEAPSRVRRAITPGVPAVGALMTLNVQIGSCSSPNLRTGRVRAVGTNLVIVEDTANPAGGFTQAQYESFAETFDTLVHPAVTAHFGTPNDIDSNGRVVAFFTRAVNALSPPGSPTYVGGLFQARDLLPAAQCPTSNVGEMFYMLVPDPGGAVNGNVRPAAFVERVTVSTLAHEFQHLINASRRLAASANLEQVWLNEGLSHVAEERVFYAATGFAPGQNLGAAAVFDGGAQQARFREFADPNFSRLRHWLMRPDTSGPFKDATTATLASRGAIWSFLRYAADRKGGSEPALWNAMVASQDTGMTNLANRLGTDPRPWFRDWAAATYLDDAVAGVPAVYTHPSWNFRSLFASLDYGPEDGCSCAFDLNVRHPANGVAQAFALSRNGGAAYLRLAVPQNAFAGVTTTTPSETFTVVVTRTK
ncbi:MAG TPA: Ig-like domain-containing protein [Longimicrobium sp.]|jgi:hypothetical protein